MTISQRLAAIQKGMNDVQLARREKNSNIKLLLKTIDERNSLAEQVALVEDTLNLLATANDKASLEVLAYIQNIINQALRRMFTTGAYEVEFRKAVTAGNNPVIHVDLHEQKGNGDVIKLDFNLQTGDGVAQIISFLFTLSLMEIRGVRPLVMLDETLKGFHPAAIPLVTNIITVFAKHGFQFVMVEYDLGIGRMYHVQQNQGVSTITHSEAKAEDLYEADAERMGVIIGSESDLESDQPNVTVDGTNTRDFTGLDIDFNLNV